MPVLDGLETTRLIKEEGPDTIVVVISMSEVYRGAALLAGADAFVAKSQSPDQLLQTLLHVVQQ
jgi:CheY-like chemotaxis protein